MLKTILTLSRSLSFTAAEKAEERYALPILVQQLREGAASVLAAQKAVALVKAQNEQERMRADKVSGMIADLEERATQAIANDEEALALEAASAIAVLEDELAASNQTQADFGDEIARLTTTVRNAQARLRELQRGQRVVTARDQVRKVGVKVAAAGGSSLADAEGTLNRIQTRQQEMDLTEAAFAELTISDTPTHIVDRLASAGCGKPLSSSPDAVLERLRRKAKSPASDVSTSQ